jgi:hypothetical protein
MKTNKHDAIILSSNDEKTFLKEFTKLLKANPLPMTCRVSYVEIE